MKHLFTTLCFALTIHSNYAHAQSMAITKNTYFSQETSTPNQTYICHSEEVLQQVSDEMFKASNPKYIWIDLLKDGLINIDDYKGYNVYIETKQKQNGGNLQIPEAVQQRYAKKLLSFLSYIEEPVTEDGAYHFHIYSGIQSTEITDSKSQLRNISKEELSSMRMHHKEDLKLLESLIADGLATADKTYSIDFSAKGFYVNKKRLSPEMSEKYSTLCYELYGTTCKESGSRFQMGPTADVTLEQKISSLKTKVALAKQKLQQTE